MALKKEKKEKKVKDKSKKKFDGAAIIAAGAKKGIKFSIRELLPNNNKHSISSQIQNGIGRSVLAVMFVVAFISIIMVNNIVNDANDKELQLESQVVSYQMAEFLAPFETMTEQLAVNTELQLLLNTLSLQKNTAKHSGYPDALANIQQIQELDTTNIRAVWFADVDASMAAMSDGYITEEGWDITTRPWFECIEKGETVYTVPYEDTATGEIVLTIASPVYNAQGKGIGVAGMDILLDDIITTMSDYKIGESGYVMLLSSEGMFIYHPDQELINTYIADLDITQSVIDAVVNKHELFTRYKVSGEGKFGYITNVGDCPYICHSE